MIKIPLAAIVVAAALSTGAFVCADAPTTAPSAAAYPLKTCIVSGEALGGDMGAPVVIEYQGRQMKFCCNGCVAKFKKDPDKYLKQLDAAAQHPTTAPSM